MNSLGVRRRRARTEIMCSSWSLETSREPALYGTVRLTCACQIPAGSEQLVLTHTDATWCVVTCAYYILKTCKESVCNEYDWLLLLF